MNLNSKLDEFLKSTVWIWLPFYAFFALIREWRQQHDKD